MLKITEINTSSKNPDWIKPILSGSDIAAIEAAVKKGEVLTSAEIVVVLVPRSGNYRTGALTIVASSCFVIATVLLALNIVRPFADNHTHNVISLGISISCLLLTGLALRFEKFKRFFTNQSDMQVTTSHRAELEFYRQGIRETRAKTGVLIFVSMYERHVIVLADKAINKMLPNAGTWNDMVEHVINGIVKKQFAKGLVAAIETASNLLAKYFPGDQVDNPNELSDKLIIYPDSN